MAFLQRVVPCPDEHEGCQAIDCITDADVLDDEGEIIFPAHSVVWVSHAPDTTHPECRLNPDHPAEGLESQDPCDDCRRHFEAEARR